MGLRITLLMAATMGVAAVGHGQQPFDLDPSFTTTIGSVGVSGISILPDGKILVSGRIKFPGDVSFRNMTRLNPNGTRDLTFTGQGSGGGKLVPWTDRYYVGTGQLMDRIWPDGMEDFSFQSPNQDPLFQSGQGGDFHVYPDGSLLITGTHTLFDTARGFVGLYNLIWLTNTGRLDTTKVHRRANGDLSRIRELADGKFIIGGGMTEYDGHAVGHIVRVFPNGELDTAFHSTATWYWPICFHETADGKILCGGDVVFEGSSDTLHLFRLLPNGDLDPTFNNHLVMQRSWDQDGIAGLSSIKPLGADKYIITGIFDQVEGQFRGGIAAVDTAGYLLEEPFGGAGCGAYNYMGSNTAIIVGIIESNEGAYYIYGGYHGYNDGTTNDPSQRMVSRLYGLDVGVEEVPVKESVMQVYPNPADQWITIVYTFPFGQTDGHLIVRDALGREVQREWLHLPRGQQALDTRSWSPGAYTVELTTGGLSVAREKLLIKH